MADDEYWYYMHDSHDHETTHYHPSEDGMEITSDDKWAAFGITVLAGFAAFLGAFSIFCIKKGQLQYVIPVALAFSVGVILHLGFLDLIPHSVENFEFALGEEVDGHDHHHHHRRLLDDDHDHGEDEALAHFFTMLCFILGVVIMIIIGKLGEKYGWGHGHGHYGFEEQRDHYGSTELANTAGDQQDTDDNAQQLVPKTNNNTEHYNYTQISYNLALALILHHLPEGIAT